MQFSPNFLGLENGTSVFQNFPKLLKTVWTQEYRTNNNIEQEGINHAYVHLYGNE